MSTILVTGATGKQGGAVARGLIQRGHTVRALTRKPDGAAAKALADAGAHIVVGALEDRASLDRAAAGADAVFSMSTPFEQGPEVEVRQGVTVADAARAAGAYLVYTSVASADRATGIPHFDSKYRVEQHIRSTGAKAAIIAPVYFMENVYFAAEQFRAGVYATPLTPGRKLAQIAVDDIAHCAIAALEDPGRFAGTRFDLAGDEVSGEDAVAILSRVSGRPFHYFQVPMEMIRQGMGEDGVRMYEWFERTGYAVDRAALASAFPGVAWTSFEAWARRQPGVGA
ncbi:MAG: NmrA/HSCARG family protein [Polyangiales bacterium]